MEKEKKLHVIARYGSLKYQETAWPYNENVHDAQVEDCVESIRQQIVDAGKEEMLSAFIIEEKIVEE